MRQDSSTGVALRFAPEFREHPREAWITAKRVPHWVESKLLNGDAGRRLQRSIEERERGIEVATHHINARAADRQNGAVKSIPGFRQQFHGSFSFGQRLFAPAEPGGTMIMTTRAVQTGRPSAGNTVVANWMINHPTTL
jgi:hypothetical protein